jgi:hypothetical protein
LHGAVQSITVDGCPATHTAIAELKKGGVLRSETKVWTSKYLNNIIEQDHRRVKQRLYPVLDFKSLERFSLECEEGKIHRRDAESAEGAQRKTCHLLLCASSVSSASLR